MIISKGSLKFIRLRRVDSELVREWRNSPKIAQFMEYREYITPEMQEAWFNSVNNQNNLYMLIESGGKKIGLLNAKDIDWEKKNLEGGLFFWDESLWNTEMPLKIVMTFTEFGLRFFHGFTMYAHILKSNERAIRFNKELGFELCEGQEDVVNQLYSATRETYYAKGAKLRKAFYTLTGKEPLKILFEPEDYRSKIADHIEPHIDYSVITHIREFDGSKEFTLEF